MRSIVPNEILDAYMHLFVSSPAYYVAKMLISGGHSVYLVGGALRDMCMKRTPKDWDLATTATPDKVMALACANVKMYPTGIDFGTVSVVIDGGEAVEVTTLRADKHYENFRKPEVVAFTSDIEEDLSRRDFTMNAMAFEVGTETFYDPYGGFEDIRDKTVKCVGRAYARFNEDALRMMRAVRFSAQLGFNIDIEILRAFGGCVQLLEYISVERIRDEFMKILVSIGVEKALNLMMVHRFFDIPNFLPEATEMLGCEQPKDFHAYDVWTHTVKAVAHVPKDEALVRLAAFFHDIGKPWTKETNEHGRITFKAHDELSSIKAEEIMKRMKFSNSDIAFVKTLVRNHMPAFQFAMSDKAVRKFLRRLGGKDDLIEGKKLLSSLMYLMSADKVAHYRNENQLDVSWSERVGTFFTRCKNIKEQVIYDHTDLAISGRDVMEHAGVAQGPQVGKILKFLEEMVLDDPELNTKDALIDLLKVRGNALV